MHPYLLILCAFLQLGTASLLTVNDFIVAPANCIRKIKNISLLLGDQKWTSIAGILRTCNDDITENTLKDIGKSILSRCLFDDVAIFSAWRMLIQRKELTTAIWDDIIKEMPSDEGVSAKRITLAKFLFTGVIAGNEGTHIPRTIPNGKVHESLGFFVNVVADLVADSSLAKLRDVYKPLQEGDHLSELEALPKLHQITMLRKVLFNVIHNENLLVDTVMNFYKVRMAALFRGDASAELLERLIQYPCLFLTDGFMWARFHD
jgi:hypothetical protein